MKPLDLDFARSPAAPRWAGWVLLIVASAFAAELGRSYVVLRKSVERQELRLSKLAKKSANSHVVRVALHPASPEEMRFARDTIRRLATPWDRLFAALESANIKGISLLSVEPNAERGEVVITGEARDYLATLNYVAALSAEKRLRWTHLVKHETKAGDPGRPLTFTVSATWSDPR